MNRFENLIDIFLNPGELFVADARYQIRTILGSCVSITLWHAPTCIGAMSHFMLPGRGGPVPPGERDGRYGDEALEMITAELASRGVAVAQCQAKIFGGGNMFPDQMRDGAINVGQRNGEAAREMLHALGVRVVSESLFGIGHRQIIFDLRNGDVWANQIAPAGQDSDAEDQTPWRG
jgi:chemotaxis protein CheD